MVLKSHLLNKPLQERKLIEEWSWHRLCLQWASSLVGGRHTKESHHACEKYHITVCSVLQQYWRMNEWRPVVKGMRFYFCLMFILIWLNRIEMCRMKTHSVIFLSPILLPVSLPAPQLSWMTPQDFAIPDHFFEFSETTVCGRVCQRAEKVSVR